MRRWLRTSVVIVAVLLGSSALTCCSAFAPSSKKTQRTATPSTRQSTKLSAAGKNKNNDREGWTFNPFDIDDLSPVDTLMRRGVIPLSIRLLNKEKYETAVVDYMQKERCDRATAQRNMDAFFNDPNGWVISYGRKRDLGEDFGDINAPTGVQKRPVFSFFWASFCFWLFFIFFPTRIQELGGIQPSAGTSGGACLVPQRDSKGGLYCEDSAKGFEKFASDYLDTLEKDPKLLK